jgi:hypothetical protein
MSSYSFKYLVKTISLAVLCTSPVFATDDKLLAMWSFDEAQGLVVKDSGENDLHGKITNPQHVKRVEGKSGKALEFSGKERGNYGCVIVSGISKLDFSKGFTFEAWLRFNDKHTRPDTCYVASNAPWKGPGWRFIIPYNTLFIQSGNGEDMWGTSSDPAEHGSLENNRWYHLAATFDGSMFRIYLDGIEAGVSKPDLSITKGTDTLTIGAYAGGLDSPIKGTLDEVKLYGRAKSGLEIIKDARLH